MENFEKGVKLGEGQFGKVIKAVQKSTGREVAIKKVRIADKKQGIHVTALREIKILKELKNPRIIELIDVFSHKENLALVMELMESDLEAVIRDRSIILSHADVKSYMKMALEALAACHQQWIVHRDIKPNNLLISSTGELKLADFGLSKIYGSPEGCRTNQVFAPWYRAPELLFGSTSYGPAVDVWAMGCVFAELLLRAVWFPGNSDINQLQRIFTALGTPSDLNWPGVKDLPNYLQFNELKPAPLHQQFPAAGQDALDLLARMVTLDPNRRIKATDALQHSYFQRDPQPTPPKQLPRPMARSDAPLERAPAPTDSAPAAPAASGCGRPEEGGSDSKGKKRRLGELNCDEGTAQEPGRSTSRAGPEDSISSKRQRMSLASVGASVAGTSPPSSLPAAAAPRGGLRPTPLLLQHQRCGGAAGTAPAVCRALDFCGEAASPSGSDGHAAGMRPGSAMQAASMEQVHPVRLRPTAACPTAERAVWAMSPGRGENANVHNLPRPSSAAAPWGCSSRWRSGVDEEVKPRACEAAGESGWPPQRNSTDGGSVGAVSPPGTACGQRMSCSDASVPKPPRPERDPAAASRRFQQVCSKHWESLGSAVGTSAFGIGVLEPLPPPPRPPRGRKSSLVSVSSASMMSLDQDADDAAEASMPAAGPARASVPHPPPASAAAKLA